MSDESGCMMNVELAIRRELAYRRKIFLSLSQPDDDLEKDLIWPLQVQSSSISISPSRSPNPCRSPCPSQTPRLSGMKRPTSSAKCPSAQLAQPLYSNRNTMHANQADNILCTICHVPCSGACSYKQHINGRKHKAKLEELKFDRNIDFQDDKLAKKQRWCQLCKVLCMDEILFKMHLNGKKHMGELRKAKCGRNNGGVIAKQQKWCELCDIGCPNDDAFKMHLDGKLHARRLHDNEKKRRAKNLGSCSRMARP